MVNYLSSRPLDDIKTYRSVAKRVSRRWSLDGNRMHDKYFHVDLAALLQAVTRSNAQRVFAGFIGKLNKYFKLITTCKKHVSN